eukprot:m.223847 g.223847  ORF g.223847 m.223847 type:complete len:1283 (+) comp10993_c0_seq1:127-3975(+)
MAMQVSNSIQVGDFAYWPEQLLGQGVFGKVFKGYSLERGAQEIVAIKIMTKKTPEESDVLSTLRHPNVLGFLAAQQLGPEEYVLVTEYCNGGDLEKFLSGRGTLGDPGVLDFCRQMAVAMVYLRTKNIIHRDIKPTNIFVSTDPVVYKLGDFGSARNRPEDLHSTFAGSPVTMAPEVHDRKERYTSAVDMWSIGCCIYYAATKAMPFEARSLEELTRMRLQPLQIDAYLERRSNLTPAIRGVVAYAVTGLLSPDPAHRMKAEELGGLFSEECGRMLTITDYMSNTTRDVCIFRRAPLGSPVQQTIAHAYAQTPVSELLVCHPTDPRGILDTDDSLKDVSQVIIVNVAAFLTKMDAALEDTVGDDFTAVDEAEAVDVDSDPAVVAHIVRAALDEHNRLAGDQQRHVTVTGAVQRAVRRLAMRFVGQFEVLGHEFEALKSAEHRMSPSDKIEYHQLEEQLLQLRDALKTDIDDSALNDAIAQRDLYLKHVLGLRDALQDQSPRVGTSVLLKLLDLLRANSKDFEQQQRRLQDELRAVVERYVSLRDRELSETSGMPDISKRLQALLQKVGRPALAAVPVPKAAPNAAIAAPAPAIAAAAAAAATSSVPTEQQRQRMAELERQIDMLRNHNKSLGLKAIETDDAMKQLQAEVAGLTSNVKTVREAAAAREEGLHAAIRELQAEVASRAQQGDVLRAELADRVSQVETLRAELATRAAQANQDVTETHAVIQAAAEAKLAAEGALADEQRRVAQLERELGIVTAKFQAAQAHLDALNEQVARAESHARLSGVEASQTKAQVEQLVQKERTARNELSSAIAKEAAAHKEIARLNEALQQSNEMTKQLRDELEHARRALQQPSPVAATQITGLNEELARVRRQVEAVTNARDSLRRELDMRTVDNIKEVERLKAEIERLRSPDVLTWTVAQESVRAEVRASEEELALAKKTIDDLVRERNQAQTDCARLVKELDATRVEVSRLAGNAATLQNTADLHRREADSVRANLQKLEQRLKEEGAKSAECQGKQNADFAALLRELEQAHELVAQSHNACEQLTVLRAELARAEARAARIAGEGDSTRAGMQAQITELQGKLAAVERQRGVHECAITALEGELQDLQGQLRAKDDALATVRAQQEDLRMHYDAASNEAIAHDRRIRQLEAAMRESSLRIQESDDEVARMDADIQKVLCLLLPHEAAQLRRDGQFRGRFLQLATKPLGSVACVSLMDFDAGDLAILLPDGTIFSRPPRLFKAHPDFIHEGTLPGLVEVVRAGDETGVLIVGQVGE